MKKERHNIVNNNELEYIITVKKTKKGYIKYTLFRSYSEIWSLHCKGERLISLIYDEQSMTVKIKDRSLDVLLEYHELNEVNVLLDFFLSRK